MSVSSRERVRFEIEAETEEEVPTATDDRPFSIALVGDFTGSAERRPITQRKPLEIDRDNFDDLIRRLAPVVTLPGGPLRFTSLDHFHPDHLYTHLPEFDRLREMRSRLSDPSTAREAIQEILGAEQRPVEPALGGSLLDAILGGGVPAAAAPAPQRPPDELEDFIRNAVRPYLVDRPDARTPELLRQTDEAAAGVLRAILHSRGFQSLESVWRTVFELVRRIETGEDLKLWLIDITQAEFAADPIAVSQYLRENGSWAVIASFYSFGSNDVTSMTEAARIGRRCGASWLAEADPSLIDAGDEWSEFRRSADAAWMALALPRVLLRMPYGKQTSTCEALDLEEITAQPQARQMLWANPAPLCAMLPAQAFERHGWNMRPGSVREIGDLPVFVYKDADGDQTAFPCAETPLTEDTAEALMDYGIMPVIWERNTDSVRVLRFQSVAQPATALQGSWGKS